MCDTITWHPRSGERPFRILNISSLSFYFFLLYIIWENFQSLLQRIHTSAINKIFCWQLSTNEIFEVCIFWLWNYLQESTVSWWKLPSGFYFDKTSNEHFTVKDSLTFVAQNDWWGENIFLGHHGTHEYSLYMIFPVTRALNLSVQG